MLAFLYIAVPLRFEKARSTAELSENMYATRNIIMDIATISAVLSLPRKRTEKYFQNSVTTLTWLLPLTQNDVLGLSKLPKIQNFCRSRSGSTSWSLRTVVSGC